MNEIQGLVKLQQIDTELQELEELLGDLPTKVEDLKDEEEQLIQSLEEGKHRIKEITMTLDKNDLEMKSISEKIDKLKDQLFLVTTNKQYDALQMEIDYLRTNLDKVELTTLEISEEKDRLEEETKTQAESLESLTQDLGDRRKRLEDLMSESAEKKTELDKRRENQMSKIDNGLLARYNRVSAARDNLVIVSVAAGSCGGCGSVVPPQVAAEVKMGNVIRSCDVCNRFWYWESE